MPHDIVNGHIGHHHHPHDHNHSHDHLHSHLRPEDAAAELQVLATQFIDGFVQAGDKTAYLRLAGVPFEKPGKGGDTALKLVDVQLTTEWPFPGEMISERTNMSLVYVSMDEKNLLDIRDFLSQRKKSETL